MNADEPYVVISTDSHAGPDVSELRDYCEADLLEDFDRFVEQVRSGVSAYTPGVGFHKSADFDELSRHQNEDIGVNDPAERLRNMDADGVTSEVIFHGSGVHSRQTGYIPFSAYGPPSPTAGNGWDKAHQAAGKRMYNRWLADFCSTHPSRLLGIAEMPYWDIQETIREIEWAASTGFKAINFAAPRPGSLTYDDPAWEPFWSAVEDHDVSLNCHSGAPVHNFEHAPGFAFRALYFSELHFLGHMPVAMMSFGGVFDRHPKLRVIFNEQRGYWVWQTLRDLDAIYFNPWNDSLRKEIPEPPSEYWRRNCFLGGSFLAHFELEHREDIGVETITWGRDYPHMEGTWPFTREGLRAAFFDVPSADVRRILGDNAARCYGLDLEELSDIAQNIGPKPSELAEPLDATPAETYSWAFRDRADAKGGARFGAY